ncbi:MAG: tRNA (adenosine(37)-N6)-threonylcarbamoyltransferase complex dimerization subunit type 1 TsaB [Methyloceanibacter sp.]
MKILALDTSMGACSAALLSADGESRRIHVRHENMARGHAEALMPMVAAVMEQAATAYRSLDVIAATVGPGSFTGVRIAIAAGRGLALVTPVKLYGADSLSVMAWAVAALGVPRAPFAVAVDARRGMLYFGFYGEGARRLDGPLLVTPEQAAVMMPEEVRIAVGSGGAMLAEAAARNGRAVEAALPSLQPSAAALAEMALKAGETVNALRPLYLRPPDAKPQPQPAARR